MCPFIITNTNESIREKNFAKCLKICEILENFSPMNISRCTVYYLNPYAYNVFGRFAENELPRDLLVKYRYEKQLFASLTVQTPVLLSEMS